LGFHFPCKVVRDVLGHDAQVGAMVTEDCHHQKVSFPVKFEGRGGVGPNFQQMTDTILENHLTLISFL
jgi:hypothetical protein